MTYDQALQYIKQVENFGIKPGLSRIEKLLSVLGNPQNNLKFIHIGGTNGKGSTTTMTANALNYAGYKVGKYISPYVYEFGERISIDNVNISPEKLAIYVEKIKQAIQLNDLASDHPSEFEIITTIAFLYFNDENCDIVCLEVGLGGTLDATNVINSPLLSVITKISLDHTQVLGDNVEQIAKEKCGIIKNSYTITYPKQQENVLAVIASLSNFLAMPDISRLEILTCDISGSEIIYNDNHYKISLLGEHQIYNAITVIEILNMVNTLGFKISFKNIYKALSNTYFSARMEIISQNPLVIIDGSHNLDGIMSLEHSLKTLFKDKSVLAIMGMLKDKDYIPCVEKISSLCTTILFTDINNPRSASSETLLKYSKCKNSMSFSSVENALDMVKNFEKDVILVCGSLYLAQDIKKFF